MSRPAYPGGPRTTCIYDPTACQLHVSTPAGQRCTFPYDGPKNSATVTVTAGRVDWKSEPAPSVACPFAAPIRDAVGTWKHDPSSIRKLTDLGGGRTTYVSNSLPDPPRNGSSPDRVTFVFEPLGAEVITLLLIPLSPEQDGYLAYLNVDRLQKQGNSEAASQVFGEFILHPLVQRMLQKACPTDGIADDVRQGAVVHLLECWISDGLSFGDCGPYQFAAWIWTVCSRACFHSMSDELRWSKIILMDGPLSEIAMSRPDRSIAEELLNAVDALQHPEARGILQEMLLGVKIADAAAARQISVGEMHKRRERAKAALRESDPDLPGLP